MSQITLTNTSKRTCRVSVLVEPGDTLVVPESQEKAFPAFITREAAKKPAAKKAAKKTASDS